MSLVFFTLTSSCGDIQKAIDELQGKKTFNELLSEENKLAIETVNNTMSLRANVDAAETALNNKDYDSYNNYWENTIPDNVTNLASSVSKLYSKEREIQSSAESRSGVSGDAQWIWILYAALSIGSLYVLVKDTDNTIKKAQLSTEQWIERRMEYYRSRGHSAAEARMFAEADSSNVRVRNGLEAAERVTKGVVTQSAETLVPSGVAAVKDAHDIATYAIGSNDQCDTNPATHRSDPSNQQTGGVCRIYVGVSSNGNFQNIPTGKWNFGFYPSDSARMSVEATINENATTTITNRVIPVNDATEGAVSDNDSNPPGDGGSAPSDNDPLPWSYGGSGSLSVTATAGYGAHGTVTCSVGTTWTITLDAAGSVTSTAAGGYWVEFDDQGNGKSCSANSGVSESFSGTYSGGSYTMTSTSGAVTSGSYNSSGITGSGGRTRSATLTNGQPVSVTTSWSFTLSRN